MPPSVRIPPPSEPIIMPLSVPPSAGRGTTGAGLSQPITVEISAATVATSVTVFRIVLPLQRMKVREERPLAGAERTWRARGVFFTDVRIRTAQTSYKYVKRLVIRGA